MFVSSNSQSSGEDGDDRHHDDQEQQRNHHGNHWNFIWGEKIPEYQTGSNNFILWDSDAGLVRQIADYMLLQ